MLGAGHVRKRGWTGKSQSGSREATRKVATVGVQGRDGGEGNQVDSETESEKTASQQAGCTVGREGGKPRRLPVLSGSAGG